MAHGILYDTSSLCAQKIAASANLFIEIGTEKSEIGIEYEIEMTAISGWHSEIRVIEEVVAI